MNSSWTGRAPHKMRDCYFSDGDPERTAERATPPHGGFRLALLPCSVMAIWNLAAR